MLNKVLGEKGTPERNQYEAELKSFLMGDAIKKARQSCNLTQEQLGERMGIKKAQKGERTLRSQQLREHSKRWGYMLISKSRGLERLPYGSQFSYQTPTNVKPSNCYCAL